MAAGAALPALFFTFAAMVLLIFASISAPTWDKISFMDVRGQGSGMTRWGVFGSSLSDSAHLGYHIPDADSGTLHALSYTLILVPIGAGLSGLAFLFGLCGAGYHRVGTILMTLTSALALLATLLAWVLSMVLFGIARKRLNNRGYHAKYQNAEWLVLGAFVSLSIAFCTGALGSFGSYRRRRAEHPATY